MVESSNLRDLLKVREEEDGHVPHRRENLTLASFLAGEKRGGRSAATAGRTLMDIIRNDEGTSSSAGNGVAWRGFKDHLRLQRAGAAWSSSAATTAGAGEGDGGAVPHLLHPLNRSQAFSRTLSIRPAASHPHPPPPPPPPEDADIEPTEEESAPPPPPPEPVRVSLMALLETDRYGIGGGETATASVGGEDGDEEEEEAEPDAGGQMYVCCVCMVRHKGAAFIPCGHTFCRLCSRELWVSRGNCPLCNGYILEILDIF